MGSLLLILEKQTRWSVTSEILANKSYFFANLACARNGEKPSWKMFPRNGKPQGPGGSLLFLLNTL